MDTNKELNKAFDVVINRLNEIAKRENYSSGICYAIEVNYQSATTNLISENRYGEGNHFKWTACDDDYGWLFFDSIKRAMVVVVDNEPESYDDFYNDYVGDKNGVWFLLSGDFQHAIILIINEWVKEVMLNDIPASTES